MKLVQKMLPPPCSRDPSWLAHIDLSIGIKGPSDSEVAQSLPVNDPAVHTSNFTSFLHALFQSRLYVNELLLALPMNRRAEQQDGRSSFK